MRIDVLFCSQQYLVFFGIVFTAYWAVPWRAARIWLLLAASFYFYASWNHWLAGVVCFSASLDYFLARAMEWTQSDRRRRSLVALSILANLSLLAYFKYANFFLGSLEQAIRATGAHVSMPVLQVLVPIGISFYTFEAINYTMDVYRRRIKAERSLAAFLLFILFFPHLIAGPIVRARDFLPQIHRAKRWNWARFHLGIQFLILGVFKKLAIADRMALLADPLFAEPGRFSSYATWMGVMAYAIQVYCDFSGYSDMAIGAAHMLGYKLAPNFNLPYLSPNIAEFWRRWHMSLSSWLRDYVFIPMGGSRCGMWRTRWNLFATMALGGLWHGAAWNFVLFGMIQGSWLGIHRSFRERVENQRGWRWLTSGPGTCLRVASTFVTFCLTLIVFRSAHVAVARTIFRRLFHACAGASPDLSPVAIWLTFAVVFIAHMASVTGWQQKVVRESAVALGCSYAVMLTIALILAPNATTGFIYFQF